MTPANLEPEQLVVENGRLRQENADLQARLQETEDTLRAIHGGEVDGFVVTTQGGQQVFTLETADRPYRLLVEKMHQGVALLGSDHSVLYANSRLAELLGQPLEKLIGAFMAQLVSQESQSHFDGLVSWARASESRGEVSLRRADGTSFPASVSMTPVPETSGALGLIVTDLTEQRHLDELRRAQAALREADRNKDEFLATLAHELRNPLSGISNASELLARRGLTESQLRIAREVLQRQTRQMARLVDDLLDVSRIRRGIIDLQMTPVTLNSVIAESLASARAFIETLNHAVSVDMPDEAVPLQADATRLTQVFLNVLNNAAKYTPAGGRIVVAVRRDQSNVEVRIRDTGIGISPENLPRVFELFTQLDRSLEKTSGGLGVGLSLARRIVELHGGTIEARSEGPGKGSEFLVRLPLVAEARTAAGEDTSHGGTPGGTPPRRILLVDDNVDSAKVLGRLLQISGHDIQIAHDGVDALEKALSFRPEVAFLDIGLPKLNGYELAERLRAHPACHQAYLVALTGWGQQEDKWLAKKAGFDRHMTKPIDFDELEQLLASLPSQRR